MYNTLEHHGYSNSFLLFSSYTFIVVLCKVTAYRYYNREFQREDLWNSLDTLESWADNLACIISPLRRTISEKKIVKTINPLTI